MRYDTRFLLVAGSVRHLHRGRWRWGIPLAAAALAVAAHPAPGRAQGSASEGDWSAVDRALGRPGKAQPGEVQKYSFPRSDLHVTVEGVAVKPALALGSWVAFKRTGSAGGQAMAMGDLVLTEAEVPAVVAKLQAGGVYQVSVPRADPVQMEGMEIPPAMGVATAINFQPTGGGKAAITGDFVLTADEVNPVLRTFGQQGIAVTALHIHMLTEEPRLFFMHFWANDDALRLARGLRMAVEQTKSKPAAS